MTAPIDTLSRIALQNAQLLAAALGFVLFLVAQRHLGRWPDLWRLRRVMLPVLDRLADGDYDEELDVVDERVGVDLEAAADGLPEKTGLPLQARELVEAISHPRLPEGAQEIRGVERSATNERTYRLANRRTAGEIVDDLREDYESLADVV